METEILELLETAAIAISGFLIKSDALLPGQFFPDRHYVFGSRERCRDSGSIIYDRIKYLS